MPIEAAITFAIAIFIFAITPGPGTFALLARALSSGAMSCLPMTFGMAISDIIYLILATMGLATIAENYTVLFTIIRFTGAFYLLYLGWKMWTTEVNAQIEKAQSKTKSWLSGFIQGFLISASNPKVILFYVAFLPTFIDLSTLTQQDIILVSFITLFSLMSGLMLVSIAASRVRQYLKSQKAMKRLNQTAGSIMIGAGLFLAYRGTTQ